MCTCPDSFRCHLNLLFPTMPYLLPSCFTDSAPVEHCTRLLIYLLIIPSRCDNVLTAVLGDSFCLNLKALSEPVSLRNSTWNSTEFHFVCLISAFDKFLRKINRSFHVTFWNCWTLSEDSEVVLLRYRKIVVTPGHCRRIIVSLP